MKISVILISCVVFLSTGSFSQQVYQEQYRPQIHFSPKAHWMNDPNGMVYNEGVYHLFFQYYPDGSVWGPMHWGHATSIDLIHWKEQPIAIYPDSNGYIYSGSAVIDKNNTSGFGNTKKAPMVAIFTQHDPIAEKKGTDTFETQNIAYSLDNGKTWTKYKRNPVLRNPGIRDFRDPKVMWYEETHKWIMTLATSDCVTFYSSKNLKEWQKESAFGKAEGAHGGVWECPDLFYLYDHGKKIWVLLVSINPGGPNGGSATQYFTGSFDGRRFTTSQKEAKWIDYGPDSYAGVTWANTGNHKIFLGWMSNWQYAELVPSENWRGANTIPRELGLVKENKEYYLTARPVAAMELLKSKTLVVGNKTGDQMEGIKNRKNVSLPIQLHITANKLKTFSIEVSNDLGEKLVIGYNEKERRYYVDRSGSGKVDFYKNFAGVSYAPRISFTNEMDIHVVIDKASVEVFADHGLSVMTDIFFPSRPFDKVQITMPGDILIKELHYVELKSIWNKSKQ